MSNRVTLVSTIFKDVHNNVESYGFRLYDNYASSYCNLLEKEEFEQMSDFDFVRAAIEYDAIDENLLEYVEENGMFINNEWYDSEELIEGLKGA